MEAILYKGIRVGTDKKCAKPVYGSTMAWAELFLAEGERPEVIQLNIFLTKGVYATLAVAGKATSLDSGRFELKVPVLWRNGIPHTRQKGKDNVDIIWFSADGVFVDIQVGVVTRKSRFFVTAQQVYCGCLADTANDREFVPVDPAHAYPGNDYGNVWSSMALAVYDVADRFHIVRPMLSVPRATWRENFPPAREGWKAGQVLYWNMITGSGMAQEYGKTDQHFFHFSQLPGEELRGVEPGTPFYFKTANEDPNSKVKVVKLL